MVQRALRKHSTLSPNFLAISISFSEGSGCMMHDVLINLSQVGFHSAGLPAPAELSAQAATSSLFC